MRTRRWRGLLVAIVDVLLLACLAMPSRATSQGNGLAVGTTAPQFTVKDLSGNPVDLSALVKRSKAVVINFWGLRCAACLEEMPSLDAIYAKYREAGLVVLGVNVDGVGPGIITENLPRILKMPGYPILPDEELKVADLYRMAAAPLTVVVDSAGVIVYLHEGYQAGDEKELETQIAKLVR